MNVSTTNSLPLIVAEENDAMLNSIINLLRQKGFVVMFHYDFTGKSSGSQPTIKLDALAILRFVDQNWPQETPISILPALMTEEVATLSIAA